MYSEMLVAIISKNAMINVDISKHRINHPMLLYSLDSYYLPQTGKGKRPVTSKIELGNRNNAYTKKSLSLGIKFSPAAYYKTKHI